jgi:hypothetical protein
MPPIDPFAPAGHERHPRQAGSRQPRRDKELRQQAADLEAYEMLAATHLTAAERAVREQARTPDDTPEVLPILPTLDELRVRVDALVDYLSRAGTDDGEPPRIIDVTGVEHVLVVSEGGEEAHWEPVARTYEDMTIAELTTILRDRQLIVSGNKPDLIKRLHEADEASAPEASE